ncbi:hypothetical protein FOA52_003245 [Chlamydomonas sp. UWO 241]|nr:hypothetical protein FOA52_003245 [Chlamydomonas sp. UWO 241]
MRPRAQLLRVAPPLSRGVPTLARSFPREREEDHTDIRGRVAAPGRHAFDILADAHQHDAEDGQGGHGEGVQRDGEGQDKSLDRQELKQLARLQLEASERIQQSQAVAHDKVLGALAKIADSSADTAAVVQSMKQNQAEKVFGAAEMNGHSDAQLKELKQFARMQLEAAREMRESLAAITATVEKLLASTTEADRQRPSAYVHIEELEQADSRR